MPNYNGIIINAATIDGKCAVCHRPLDEEASICLTFGFRTSNFCPDCLIKILKGYPKVKADIDTFQEAVTGLQKQIDALKKEKKDGKGKKEGQSTAVSPV